MGRGAKGFIKGVSRSLARNMQAGMDADSQAERDRVLAMKQQNLARYSKGLATEENIRQEGVTAKESALDRASREKISGMKGTKVNKEDVLSRKDAMKYAYDYGGAADPEQAIRIADQLQGKTVAEMEAVKEDKGYWATLWGAISGQGGSEAPQLTSPTTAQAAGTEAPTVGGRTPAPPAAPALPAESASIPQPQTKADFDKLPSGSVYIDPKSGKKFKKK
jgi:hypothetical protein